MGIITSVDASAFGADDKDKDKDETAEDTTSPWVDEVFKPTTDGTKGIGDADRETVQAPVEGDDDSDNEPKEPKADDKPGDKGVGPAKPVGKADEVGDKKADGPTKAVDKADDKKDDKAKKPDVVADKSARYVPADVPTKAQDLLSKESNNTRKELLEKLKTEKSNAERIKILQQLINGKMDTETRRELVPPETAPEKRRVLEDMLAREREVDRRYKIMRETVMKSLPDFKDFYLTGERDQSRQQVYLALIREDGVAGVKDVRELLGLEADKDKQAKINALLNDQGDLDRVETVKELLKGETDNRKKQLLEQILKHETNVKLFGTMLDDRPSEDSIKAVTELFKDEAQANRLKAIVTETDKQRNLLLTAMINDCGRPDVKTNLEKVKKEENRDERIKLLTAMLKDENDGFTQTRVKQLLEMERKTVICADLPKEELRRRDTFQALDKAETGDYDAIMKAYPLCTEWLSNAVPEAFVEIGYQMGMPIPPGCPMKLPIEHDRPIPPRLMELYAKEGRIKFTMEGDAEKLLNPSEKLEPTATLINSVEWLYTTKGQIREKSLRFEADAVVDTLRKCFGEEGKKKYGPDGIPKGWMPPKNVEDIPAWRERVMYVVNLGNRLRNYSQAMKSIDGIQNSDEAIKELQALGVEMEFGKKGRLLKFNVAALDGLDLRKQIPANNKETKGFEAWLAKHHKEVDKALDPYRQAVEDLVAKKDPKAFLRFGDFPFNESIHPNIGVPYDLVSQRVTSVEEKGGKVIVKGTVSYQTTSWYSYNYWLGCDPVGSKQAMADFRATNGLADGAEPKVGEKYKIKGADGQPYPDWTYKGKNPDGSLNFSRDEEFTIEKSSDEYIPAMTAMGSIQLLKGPDDVNRWLYGSKLDWNPTKCELPQVGFWHHGVKWGKFVMDVGLTAYGGAGIMAKGVSWGARAMSMGRFAVGMAGLSHHIIDHKLPKPWKDGIHTASHLFILADIGGGLGLSTFKKAFGIGKAAGESASLLNTIGHGVLAVDGIAIFGPIVATDIKNRIDNHMGWTTQQALDRALDDRGTPERLVKKDGEDAKPAKFDLADEKVRKSMEVMLDRLSKTMLAETTDAKTRERIEKLVKDGKAAMALPKDNPERQKFVANLSKLFTSTDEATVWGQICSQSGKYEPKFRQEMQSKVRPGEPQSSQEKLIAASLALVLQANDKGELPETVLSRKVTIPAHKEYNGKDWVEVAESTIDVSVGRNELVNFVERLAESAPQDSLKMGAAKMLWRMGKLDNHGLAGALIDVAKTSNNRELVGLAMIDTEDVSLGFLLNDIMDEEIRVSKNGYIAQQRYRAKYYGLTADALRADLKDLMSDSKKGPDARALATEVLFANDNDKVDDRKRALEDCDRRWKKEGGKDGAFATDYVKNLKFMAQENIETTPVDRKIIVMEKGEAKEKTIKLQPDDVRLEKLQALVALKELGTIKVDGEDYKITPEMLNANLLKCMSKTKIDLSLAAVQQMDIAKLTTAERKELLAVLSWPNTQESQKLKVEILKNARAITGGDRAIATDLKSRLLDMLNPRSRARESEDYSFVGDYPDLHASCITALASFGCQYSGTVPEKQDSMTVAEFEGRLVEGQDKTLSLGRYYQFKEGDSVSWYRYTGNGADNKEKFMKQGDPTVATIVRHLKDAEFIGSAKVRLAVVQAAGDLQIPGLRELMNEAVKKELDPRVARRIREVRFPEEPPLDPKSDQSIEKLQAHVTKILEDQQFKHLDWYGERLKESRPILFDKNFRDAWTGAVDSTYSGIGGFFEFGADKVGSLFGGKDTKEYFKDATDGVDKKYTEALDELVKDAKTGKDSDTRTKAIQALLWIIVNRGADMPVRWRNYTIDVATIAFLDLSKQGCKERGSAVKWCVEKVLTQQPDLHPDVKNIFLASLIQMCDADKSDVKNDQAMTKEQVAKILYLATTAQAGFPDKGDPRYDKEVKFRRTMINLLGDYCRDGSSAELLEAIAEFHKSPELRECAADNVRWLRDGITRNIVDARRNNPDTTSSVQLRKNAIIDNLTDSSKSTEDVVRAIAKAVEGYEWHKNAENDAVLLSALRQAREDQRTRVKLIASRYMLYRGDGDDLMQATETLSTIIDTPYKYASSPRDLKFYRLEAESILSQFEKGIEKSPHKAKLLEIMQEGKNLAKEKKDGSVLAYAIVRPDMKSLATAQQELDQILDKENVNELDVVKAVMSVKQKMGKNPVGPTDPVLDLYTRAMEHRSEKVRMAGAWALMLTTPNEAELSRAVGVLKGLNQDSTNPQLKKEAGQWLDFVSKLSRYSVGGLNIASEATLPTADRAKTCERLGAYVKAPKAESVNTAVQDIFSLRSPDGKLKADDSALKVLKEAVASDFLAVSLAACMVLAEQSPGAQDAKAAMALVLAKQNTRYPDRIRKDAETFIARMKKTDKAKASVIADLEAEIDKDMGLLVEVTRGLKPTESKDLTANAAKLTASIEAAKEKPGKAASNDAVKAIVQFGLGENAFAKDSPVAKKIRETALAHPDERVQLAAAWMLAQGAPGQDDESTGIMILAQLVAKGKGPSVRLEANSVLRTLGDTYETLLADEKTPADQKTRARWAINEIKRQREAAVKE